MTRWPQFAEDEQAAVLRVLASGRVNYWTGEEGRAFESEFASYVGASHAVACANGTVALELGLRALGVGAGDDVVVPARTFIATASAVVAVGARPVVADVDRDSGGLTAETIRSALTSATRAVIPVHVGGWPCDMDGIMTLAHERGVFVIEDCAQAHGARWRGRHVGTFGHVGAFSFCQDKIMTTAGEGGMLITSDEALWRRAWEYKDHGRGIDALERARSTGGHEFKWTVAGFGTNWRMTEVQAAVGRVQLGKVDDWVTVRRRNAAFLDEALDAVPGVRVVRPPAEAYHSYYKYYAFLEPGALAEGWTRARVLDEVNARGVVCMSGVCPEIHREEAFSAAGLAPARPLPVAHELGETSLMLLVDPAHTVTDIERAAEVLSQVLHVAVAAR